MKNSILLKILSLILLISIMISAVSCKKSDNKEELDTGESQQTVEVKKSFSLNKNYKIVRSDECFKDEKNASLLVSRGIKEACGIDLSVIKDNSKAVSADQCEIIIGKADREAAQDAYAELTYLDWKYKIISENCIVICGGSPEMTLEAAKEFLYDAFRYEENEKTELPITKGENKELITGTEKIHKHEYKIESIKIGNKDISEYSIVSLEFGLASACRVARAFGELSGVKMPIVNTKEFKGGPAVFVGMKDVSGNHLDKEIYGFQRYFVEESGENIIIDFKSYLVGKYAVQAFLDEYVTDSKNGEIKISLGHKPIGEYYISEGTNGFKKIDSHSENVTNGITYEVVNYKDKYNNPVVSYVLTIKKGSAKLYTGTPDDGTVLLDKADTVKNEMLDAVANGKNVIAGVNADFFRISSDKLPSGLCIKNGEELHGVSNRTWVGFTKTGDCVIGNASDYTEKYKGKLDMAVGGGGILLKDDNCFLNNSADDASSSARHPRTAIGVKPNGDIVIIVIDGRNKEYSNGACLLDMVQIFVSYGCIDAINLDGGGSSTFVLKDSNNEFKVMNKPSDKWERRIQNSLLVVLPD